jgi:hypothetical protein
VNNLAQWAGWVVIAGVSMEELKTRNVFLDAEPFRSGGFNYRSTPFKTLIELAAAGEVRVFTTDITVREVTALIRENVQNAFRAQKAFNKQAYILRNCKSALAQDRFKPLDPKSVEKELVTQFEQFLKDVKAVILPTNKVSVNEVFDSYFSMRPPFGPGKKKDEFPDAFASAAVGAWCVKEKQEIYVISGDSDMRSVCGDGVLHSIKKLTGFLDLVVSHSKHKKTVAFVKAQIPGIEKMVIDEIKNQFEDLGFILHDQEGDVEDVTVLEVVMGDIDVLHATDKEATLETEAEVTFEADLSYGDEGTASYDSEDKTVFYHDHVNETVQRTKYISVELDVFYEVGDPDSFDVNDVSIDRDTILVRSSQDDGWPYK